MAILAARKLSRSGRGVRRLIKTRFFLILLLLFTPTFLFAAEPLSSEPPVVVAPSYPGLSDLGPRRIQLIDFVQKSDDRLEELANLQDIEPQFQKLSEQIKELRQKVATMGDPATWYVDRLSQVNNQFRQARKDLAGLQRDLTGRQQEVERINAHLQEEDTFWRGWGAELKKQKVKVPKKTVQEVSGALKKLDLAVTKASTSVLHLQEQIGASQQTVIGEIDQFGAALEKVRKATFRKNAHSFFAPEFYQQFGAEWQQQMRDGLYSALRLDWDYLRQFNWLLGLMMLTLLVSAIVVRHYRDRFHGTEDWQFVLTHPWAVAVFAVVVVFTLLFPAPPAVVRFVMLALGVLAATTLAAPLMENRRQARVLILTALILIITTAFRLISLPQPFYRLYIALLALAAIPLLIWQINCSHKSRGEGAGRFFRFLLRIGLIVLSISLAGQISGYMNFSFWLLEASFETGTVILFANMLLRLGNGGIDFMLGIERVAQRKFFKKFAGDLTRRLQQLLRMIVMIYSFFYLLPVWRVFSSAGDAWGFFSKLGVTVGDVQVSLRMVLFALISFYLAMQVSWLLQGLCETQVFYRKEVDRGVRDAIKKLVHYGMVLIGFLFVLSSLGMSLQNFVVVLGAFGVGIGFGLQDIVNNFLSGLILLFERPIKVGDAILVDGEYGTVKSIGLRSTRVETANQSDLIVPNGQMISQKVTNLSLSNRRARIVLPVGVAYGTDVPQVLTILTAVAAAHPGVLAAPEPSPIFIAFGASSLDFQLRVWVENVDDRLMIGSELLQEIDARFREAGVEIPFPQRDLHLRSADGKLFESFSEVVRPQTEDPNPS